MGINNTLRLIIPASIVFSAQVTQDVLVKRCIAIAPSAFPRLNCAAGIIEKRTFIW